MFYYIHGFNSSTENNKQKIEELSKHFDIKCLKYYSEDTAGNIFNYLVSQIEEEPEMFIGTSLGGFWAEQMADFYASKAVLINPCYKPTYFLKQFIGTNVIFGKDISYEFTQDMLDSYEEFEQFTNCPKLVFTGIMDNIIDWKLVKMHYEVNSKVVITNDEHGIKSFKNYINYIKQLLNTEIL